MSVFDPTMEDKNANGGVKHIGAEEFSDESALHYAASTDNTACVQQILEQKVVNPLEKNADGETALMVACRKNVSLATIKLLVQTGNDIVNTCNKHNISPLMRACERSTLEVVLELIDAGAEVNMQDHDGWSPLYYAVHRGNDIVNCLLNSGADVNIRTSDGGTLLHRAVVYDVKCIEVLITMFKDINVTNNEGMTALMAACKMGRPEISQLLIQHNADINITDMSGRLALHHALMNKETPLYMMLHLAENTADYFGPGLHSNEAACCMETLVNVWKNNKDDGKVILNLLLKYKVQIVLQYQHICHSLNPKESLELIATLVRYNIPLEGFIQSFFSHTLLSRDSTLIEYIAELIPVSLQFCLHTSDITLETLRNVFDLEAKRCLDAHSKLLLHDFYPKMVTLAAPITENRLTNFSEEHKQKLKAYLEVPSLKLMCRHEIRTRLDQHSAAYSDLRRNVSQLPLPECLELFLM